MNEYERKAKLAKIERRNADAMVAVVLNGRKASEVMGMQLACEALSCAVMAAHRARVVGLPKRLQKRVENAHAQLVAVVLDVAGELSQAITRQR